jgi:hypothetical protein
MRLFWINALAAALALAAAATPLRAQSDSIDKTDSDRLLQVFDFEERSLGNVEDTPMHWQKVDGPDLPHYVVGRLTTDRARSGRYSFRMDLDGGSCVYRFPSGRIRVLTGAHYRVAGYCQTTQLVSARARLTAYFTDEDGHLLPATVRHSDLLASPPDDASWRLLSMELSADSPQAAFLVLEMELLQPNLYTSTSLGQRALFVQDVHGSAWFDDITVSQVPQVKMSTERAGNIFRRGDPLKLTISINDRFTDDLDAQLRLRDALGRPVYQQTGGLAVAAAETLGPGHRRMSLMLPDVPPGWYRATLSIDSHGVFVGRQSLDLVVLADDAAPAAPDPRFGLIATNLPFAGWSDLPQILPILGVGRVKLAVWSEAGDVQQMDSGAFDALLQGLSMQGITPTACLISPPPNLVKKLNGKSWMQLLAAPEQDWQGPLAYLISRHANHLDRWQLGADGSDEFVTNPGMRRVYSMVYKQFATLIQTPDLAMPWPAWYDLQGSLPATVALSIPPSVLPAQLPLYMEDLKGRAGHNLSLSLSLLDTATYGRAVMIEDFVQRVVYALSADATRIDLPLPFNVRTLPDGAVDKQPQELLLVMRTLITTLSGSTFKGQLPLGEGVQAFLFEKDNQGIVILWNTGNEHAVRSLAISLGRKPMRLDLWGNVTPLLEASPPRAAGATSTATDEDAAAYGKVRLDVDPMPVILTGVDARLAQFRSSVAIDQPLIESSFEPHTRRIRFTNPYDQSIGGTLKIRPPHGWTLNPPTFSFTLNPGENFDREVTIEFPYNSIAGKKTLSAEFVLQADRTINFAVPITLTLGLSDVGMQTLALRDGNDVVVQQMITNYGEAPINYTAFALFPGQPRQERLITQLGPGKTTIKKYRIANVDFTRSAKVRSGVKEIDGTRVLNDEVAIR